MKHPIARLTIVLFSLVLSCAAQQVNGSGTPGRIAIWSGSTSPSNTLGNSALFQTGGKVGIGTTSPAARLDVIGLNGTIGSNGGNAPLALRVIGGRGAGTSATEVGMGGSVLISGGPGAFSACIPGDGCTIGGTGGSITLIPGAGGTGPRPGHPGNIVLAGRVGVGTSSPAATLDVAIGHTTLADAWTTRSSRRFKRNVEPLQGALEKIEQLQGVS